MTVSIDEHSGFCFGVTSAINAAEKELAKGQLFCLGDIVHNGQEVDRLEKMGLVTIDYDDLRTLHNVRVLLRAHGEPPSTYNIAKQNNIDIIDASCPVVLHLQKRIRDTYLAHPEAQIVIFGKVGHAEVIGLMGQTNNNAIIVESPADIDKIDFSRDIYLFSQTTMSVEAYNSLIERISQRQRSFSEAVLQRSGLTGEAAPVSKRFEHFDTICRNVANRVAQLQAFAREQDLVIFVGGSKSSNAKVLYNHCLTANPNTIFISSADELKEKITNIKSSTAYRVGICGATSTPHWLMEQVKERLLSLA